MKALTVFVTALVALTSGYVIKVPDATIPEPTSASSRWIHLQKLVLPLFENVCEESSDPVICRLSTEFTSKITADEDFWDPEVLTKFQNLISGKGLLPKCQIFSEYNAEHTDELSIIFDVMINAKTFDTFYEVAAWARQNVNCGLYVSLIYLALAMRKDTEKLTVPPPYESLPNYFIRKDVIIRASSILAGEEFTPSEDVRVEGNAYTLEANYTANIDDDDDESKLAYFREDVGLNSYYFLRMLKLAPWLHETVDINSRYGEEMYFMMKQLVARYNLERYSNGIPEQDNLNWDSLSDAPYDPMLVYSNGNEFIHRTSPVQLPENEDKALLKTIERNIAIVVTHMRDIGYNKTQILNHLIEILVTGERSYITLARQLLGKALRSNGQPTIFEHYMTALRDPLIWKLYKNIVDLVDNSLKILPPYTRSELYFPGVELLGVDVKKMLTNFDYYEFDITEALKMGNDDNKFQVNIRQPRLNHKPFVIKLNISSLVAQKGLVKVYLGPKVMPGEFAKKKSLFELLDSFEINLKKGSNTVTKTSNDMDIFSPDFMSIKTLRKRVEDSEFGLDSSPLNSIESQIGFPERLVLPRGTPEGIPLQLFVFVAPYMKTSVKGPQSLPIMEFNSAVLSSLYPLDLAMEDRILLDLPNALVKDILITHKGAAKASKYGNFGPTKPWYNNNSLSPKSNLDSDASFNSNSRKKPFELDEVSIDSNDLENIDINNYYYMQSDNSLNDVTQIYPKTLRYDYSFRPNQPYDYRPSRPQYPNTESTSKKVYNEIIYKNRSMEAPLKSKDDFKEIYNKDQNNPPEVKQLAEDNYEEEEGVGMENKKFRNSDASLNVKHNLLKSTGFGIYSKQRKAFDHNSIPRKNIVKGDNNKSYNVTHRTTENSTDGEGNENNIGNDNSVMVSKDKSRTSKNIPSDKYTDTLKDGYNNFVTDKKVFESIQQFFQIMHTTKE